MADLRVTIRTVIDDLGVEDIDEALEDLAESHSLLKAFLERRSQNPIGSETTQLPVSSQVVFNLHAGRHRGLTWHDKSEDVVWLLGCRWHESGSHDDAYRVFQRLEALPR